jgi:predicted nuclease with TOPRIM domain
MNAERIRELRDIVRNFIPTRGMLKTLCGEYDGAQAYKDIIAVLDEVSSLRDEVERLREWSKQLEDGHASLEKKWRKAEADNASLRRLLRESITLAQDKEAELALAAQRRSHD